MSRFLLFGLGLVWWPLTAHAQEGPQPTITATHISSEISVDGRLDEAAWANAISIENFTQRELSVGEPATERTRVAILYSDRALYIGFWGYDSEPEGIVASQMARDFSSRSDDNFAVIIDSYNDDRSGYLFTTNPNGARADALILEGGNQRNSDWNGVWYAKSRITNEGWFSEIEIPFSTLKFTDQPTQEWGINFERNIRRKREQVRWQAFSRDSRLEQVAKAGTLVGLSNIAGRRQVDIRPYAMGGLSQSKGEKGTSVQDIGLDVGYSVTPTIKVDVTINPDFAQADVDRSQVNLSRFPLFFPEKRTFFLEGQNFFSFNLGSSTRPFYSRRIGRTDSGEETTILGGVRVLGKAGGSTIGGMSLQTVGGKPGSDAHFTTVRFKQDVLKQSTVGIISSTRFEAGRVNTTYGVDGFYSMDNLFGDKNLEAGVAIAQTYTSDRPDRTGMAHYIFVSMPNDFIEFDAAWERAGKEFNPEVGFQRRSSFQHFYTELQFNPRPTTLFPWLQQAVVKPLELNYYIDDVTKKMQTVSMEFRPLGFTTQGGEDFEFNIQRSGERLDKPFEIFDDVFVPQDTYWVTRYGAQIETFTGRSVSGSIDASFGDFLSGKRVELQQDLTWRAGKHLSLRADYAYNKISFGNDSYDVHEVGGRASYAVNPDLFGSLAGQWNSEDKEILLNFRMNWIPKPGTDFFFVVNQQVDTDEGAWKLTQTTLLAKLVWRFVM